VTCRAAINQALIRSESIEVTWRRLDGQEAVTLTFTYPTPETASEALDAILMAVEAHRRGSRPHVPTRSQSMGESPGGPR